MGQCSTMDVLERDALLAVVVADALAKEVIKAEVIGVDKDAVAACERDAPQVITSINRAQEDLRVLQVVRAMRDRCPGLQWSSWPPGHPGPRFVPRLVGGDGPTAADPLSPLVGIITVSQRHDCSRHGSAGAESEPPRSAEF